MRGSLLGSTLLSVLVAAGTAGCKRHDVIGQAQAAQVAPRPADAPRLLGGDDEDNLGRGNEKSGNGAKKWRDTGVYVDGKPVGVLDFGELPIGLKPTWVEEEHSVEIEPGSHSSGVKLVPARRYRFTDYFKAIGLDLHKIKEVHVMGPKLTEVVVVKGRELLTKKANDFQFRFGGIVGGKAIPVVPPNFGNNVKPDKIAAVMVYIDKKPPDVVEDQGLVLDGKVVDGIPYFGQPLRGGVRVYQDDKLKLQIKRPMLRETPFVVGPDGHSQWKLWPLLESKGVDTKKIVEAWAIVDERRKQRFTRDELASLTFEMGEKGNNEILLGPNKVRASALAFHDHVLSKDELPQIRPDEDQ